MFAAIQITIDVTALLIATLVAERNTVSNHKIFCAFGAYAVDVIDPQATVVLPLSNVHDLANPIDPAKLITLDLGQRLKNVVWDEVILDTTGVDDAGNDKGVAPAYSDVDGINVLTVGPKFHGQHVGGIYIERSKFFSEIRPVFDPQKTLWPQPNLRVYELMSSAARRQDGSVVRYHGFHATVLESNGSVKQLGVLVRGHQVSVKVDMASRDECDDPVILAPDVTDPAHPDIKTVLLDASSLPTPDGGAVFLPLATCAKNHLLSPKEPIAAG